MLYKNSMEIMLRLEEEKDYSIVETLTREAFWNIYVPGCSEHVVIHNLRKTKEFIPALDFVAIQDNKIIGNIVYVQSKIVHGDKEYPVLTFGPISVSAQYQKMGVGSALIKHTIKLSKEMGYKAILIYGDPAYYERFGFKVSKEYNITDKEGKYPAALLVLELYPHALKGIIGIYDYGNIYEVNEEELEEYEKKFIKKEKQITKEQDRFKELSHKYYE
jgi:predicted N-acetyltransferase YhbS